MTRRVLAYVENGSTYLDAIEEITRDLKIDPGSVATLLEEAIKDNLEAEVRAMNMLKK